MAILNNQNQFLKLQYNNDIKPLNQDGGTTKQVAQVANNEPQKLTEREILDNYKLGKTTIEETLALLNDVKVSEQLENINVNINSNNGKNIELTPGTKKPVPLPDVIPTPVPTKTPTTQTQEKQELNFEINASKINYSKIDGYKNGGEIYERGKGWSGSKDKAYNKGVELLNSDALKSQIKSQFINVCSQNNIDFSALEKVFDKLYNQCVSDTLNTEGMITGRGARGLSSQGKAYINIQNLVDTFIKNFNSKISDACNDYLHNDVDAVINEKDVIGYYSYWSDETNAILALNSTPAGKQIIKDSISKNPDGSVTVTFKGVGASYTIPVDEIAEYKNKDSSYKRGDDDILVIAIALDRVKRDIKAGKIDDDKIPSYASMPNHAGDLLYCLTGVVPSYTSGTENLSKEKILEILQNAYDSGNTALLFSSSMNATNKVKATCLNKNKEPGESLTIDFDDNFYISDITNNTVTITNANRLGGGFAYEYFMLSWDEFANIGFGSFAEVNINNTTTPTPENKPQPKPDIEPDTKPDIEPDTKPDIEVPFDNKVNGELDTAVGRGQNMSNGWMVADALAVANTEVGKEILKESIVSNDDGSVTVTFKGVNASYTITADEIKKFDTDNILTDKYSNGDNDMLVLELAMEKLSNDVKNGKIKPEKYTAELKQMAQDMNDDGTTYEMPVTWLLTGVDKKVTSISNNDNLKSELQKLQNSTTNSSNLSDAEALAKAMKDLGLRKTYYSDGGNVYCQIHNPNKPAGDYTQQVHYYWDAQSQEMIEIPGVYYVSSDGHEVKNFIEKYKATKNTAETKTNANIAIVAEISLTAGKKVEATCVDGTKFTHSANKNCRHNFVIKNIENGTVTFVNPYETSGKEYTMTFDEFAKLNVKYIETTDLSGLADKSDVNKPQPKPDIEPDTKPDIEVEYNFPELVDMNQDAKDTEAAAAKMGLKPSVCKNVYTKNLNGFVVHYIWNSNDKEFEIAATIKEIHADGSYTTRTGQNVKTAYNAFVAAAILGYTPTTTEGLYSKNGSYFYFDEATKNFVEIDKDAFKK